MKPDPANEGTPVALALPVLVHDLLECLEEQAEGNIGVATSILAVSVSAIASEVSQQLPPDKYQEFREFVMRYLQDAIDILNAPNPKQAYDDILNKRIITWETTHPDETLN